MKVKSKKNKRKSKDSCTDKRVQFENYFAWNIVIDLCFFSSFTLFKVYSVTSLYCIVCLFDLIPLILGNLWTIIRGSTLTSLKISLSLSL